jgi:hypothetical protein
MPGSASLVRQHLVIATVAAFLLLSARRAIAHRCQMDHKNAFQLRESGPNLRWCCGISGRKNGPRHYQRPSVKSDRRACCPYRLALTWMGKSLYQMNPIGPVNTFST